MLHRQAVPLEDQTMQTLLTAAAILALLTGVDSAQAHDRHDHDRRDGGPPRLW